MQIRGDEALMGLRPRHSGKWPLSTHRLPAFLSLLAERCYRTTATTSGQACRGWVAIFLARPSYRLHEKYYPALRRAELPSLIQNRASRAVVHRRVLRCADGNRYPTAERWRDPRLGSGR